MVTKAYSRDISSWIEVEPPEDNDTEGCRDWFQITNHSRTEWKVYLDNEQVFAEIIDPIEVRRQRPVCAPPFALYEPKGSRRKSGKETYDFKAVLVPDGWIVGYYRGEFGGHLYWYGHDGVDTYKITNHNVVQFVYWLGNLYAVEGCAHLGISHGSILRLEKDKTDGRWTAVHTLDLDDAPYSVVERKSGTLLITLSEHIVEVRQDMALQTIVDVSKGNIGWSCLYPNTSVLSADDQKLYIGMRQFVAELDIQTGRLRYLLPSLDYFGREERAQTRFKGEMENTAETVDSLWAYCTASDRFAPCEWETMLNRLVSDTSDRNSLPRPFDPPALMTIVGTEIKKQIQLNLRAHIEWARDHGKLNELGRILRSLDEREWVHLGTF